MNSEPTPEQMWDKFTEHLKVAMPLGKVKAQVGNKTVTTDQMISHKNFIGSIAKYRKIFLEANK